MTGQRSDSAWSSKDQETCEIIGRQYRQLLQSSPDENKPENMAGAAHSMLVSFYKFAKINKKEWLIAYEAIPFEYISRQDVEETFAKYMVCQDPPRSPGPAFVVNNIRSALGRAMLDNSALGKNNRTCLWRKTVLERNVLWAKWIDIGKLANQLGVVLTSGPGNIEKLDEDVECSRIYAQFFWEALIPCFRQMLSDIEGIEGQGDNGARIRELLYSRFFWGIAQHCIRHLRNATFRLQSETGRLFSCECTRQSGMSVSRSLSG